MKRAEKMLHSFRLLYRAAAGALNRPRRAVAPLRGGGGGVRGGCGGGGTFAASMRARSISQSLENLLVGPMSMKLHERCVKTLRNSILQATDALKRVQRQQDRTQRRL